MRMRMSELMEAIDNEKGYTEMNSGQEQVIPVIPNSSGEMFLSAGSFFVQVLVNGFMLTIRINHDAPRTYVFESMEALLKFIEDCGIVTLDEDKVIKAL